jgi:hypothetical protein
MYVKMTKALYIDVDHNIAHAVSIKISIIKINKIFKFE